MEEIRIDSWEKAIVEASDFILFACMDVMEVLDKLEDEIETSRRVRREEPLILADQAKDLHILGVARHATPDAADR